MLHLLTAFYLKIIYFFSKAAVSIKISNLFVSVTFDLSCPILEIKISKNCILYCLVLLNSGFLNLVCFDLV